MEKIIDVQHIKKAFGKVQAVHDVSFYVEKGDLFSFIGTNGAGKSTVISIILTLLQPDDGSVFVNGYEAGKNNAQIREKIGVVFQESLLDPLLTVEENLHVRAQFYGMDKTARTEAIERVADTTGIRPILKRRYGKLSGGQKRRSDIARALLHEPAILLLDEPTTGLDPQSRQMIWEMIGRLQKDRGMTVFLTTHYIEEAGGSDYVVVINEGKIIAKGTPASLKDRYSADRLLLTPSDSTQLQEHLTQRGIAFTEENGVLLIDLGHTLDAVPLITDTRSFLASFEVQKSSLHDVFIRIHEGKDVMSDVAVR